MNLEEMMSEINRRPKNFFEPVSPETKAQTEKFLKASNMEDPELSEEAEALVRFWFEGRISDAELRAVLLQRVREEAIRCGLCGV